MPHTACNERYSGQDCLIDGLEAVGHVRTDHPEPNNLEPHLHDDAFEFCYIADGQTEYWTEEGTHKVQRGQFFVTRPFEIHGGVNTTTNPRDIYWIRLALSPSGTVAGMNQQETNELIECLYGAIDHVFSAFEDPCPYFDRILECLRDDRGFRGMALRTAFHSVLLTILSSLGFCRLNGTSAPRRGFDPVIQARTWIDDHLTEEFTMQTVAEECGVSESYLRKLFVEATGQGPAEYRTCARLALAKQRITQDSDSITSIAMDLGFSSSQYFATVFKSYTGTTPRMYRKLSKSGALPKRFIPTDHFQPNGRPVIER